LACRGSSIDIKVNTQHVFGLALEVTGDMVKESGNSTADANEDDELESEGTSDHKGKHTYKKMYVCVSRKKQSAWFQRCVDTMKSAVVDGRTPMKILKAKIRPTIRQTHTHKIHSFVHVKYETNVCARDTRLHTGSA
jgi:hypothetical protein